LAPKTKRASPKAILIMVVNMEFIGGSFELVIW
jgi:hypothetical protein